MAETATHNGKTFRVSGWPHPTREITQRGVVGSAQFVYDAPTYTSGAPTPKYIDERDLQGFEEALIGWSREDPVNIGRLNRYQPFDWPRETKGALAVTAMKLPNEGRGAMSEGGGAPTVGPTLTNLPPYDYWPGTPRNLYTATFTALPWIRFLDDTEAYAGVSPPRELGRYIKYDMIYVPREFRRPDYGFVTDTTPEQTALQVGFVPFIQAEVKYIWYQVPYPEGIPYTTIYNTLLRTNATLFDGNAGDSGWNAGTLLFTRTGSLNDYYFGPGGRKYIDVEYNFTFAPYGWNFYITPVLYSSGFPVVVPLKRKGVSPATPPYALGDFTQLFNPGAP
jgi:hypothetical protein